MTGPTKRPAVRPRRLAPIPQWRRAWRLASVQAAAVLAAVSMLQTDVLPVMSDVVPPSAGPWLSLAFAVLIAVLRLVAQPAALTPPASTESAHQEDS